MKFDWNDRIRKIIEKNAGGIIRFEKLKKEVSRIDPVLFELSERDKEL